MMLRLVIAVALMLAPICTEAKSGGPPVTPVPWTFWGAQPNSPATDWPASPVATGRLWACGNEGSLWQFVETAPGIYNWATLDACVAAYRARGAYIIYTFGGVPSWANGGGTRDIPPASTSSISAFATAVATRYRGQINAYEAWNEINEAGDWWSGTNAQLIAIVQAEQSAIVAADPSALFISPSTTGASGMKGMAGYLAAGGNSNTSLLNFHSYALYATTVQPPEQNASICEYYRNLADQYGLNAAPLWTDEGGWGDGTIVSTASLQEAYGSIWALQYASCGVQRALWYQYDIGSGGSIWGEQWTGSALTPGGLAYFTTESMLNGATFTTPIARIEGANQVRNPSAAGAVAGAPGTLPANWLDFEPDSAHGVTTSIVGTGVETGIPYLDFQVSGTSTSGAAGSTQINFDMIAATLGQQWTPCVYLKLVGGTAMTPETPGIEFQELDSGGGFLQSDAALKFIALTTPLNQNRWCFSAKTTNASVAFVSPLVEIDYDVGVAFSITLRLGFPSIDTGSLWSGTFTKAGGLQGVAIWDSAGGPTNWTPPSWCSWVTNYAGVKTVVSGPLSLTNVPQFCTNQ